jgi:hypothetical protein
MELWHLKWLKKNGEQQRKGAQKQRVNDGEEPQR